MSLTLSSLSANLYTAIATLLLTSWTLIALSFTALNVLNANSSIIESFASISLLTFLLARLLVLSQPTITPPKTPTTTTTTHESLPQILTTLHSRSRNSALLLFTFTCAWIYELLCKSVLLFFVTVFGGVVATVLYNDPNVNQPQQDGDSDVGAGTSTTALAELDEFKTRAGVDFDPSAVFRWIPPRALVYFAVLVWGNFAMLGVYVLRYAWRALRRVVREEGGAQGKDRE